MPKGFNSHPKNSTSESIYKQIKKLVENLESQKDDSIIIFATSEKRRPALSKVVHRISQEFTKFHFQVQYVEGNPGVLVGPRQVNQKLSSCTWVERSQITGKWLVMASPPGAWDYRCLTVWRDEQKALEVSSSIDKLIRTMPLKDWNKRIGAYQTLLESLPDDDDTVIGGVNPSTGQVISFDEPTRDKIEGLLHQSLAEPNNPEIRRQIQEFFP